MYYFYRTYVLSAGLCPECSDKLNYRSKKREVKRLKKKKKTKHKDKQVVENESEGESPRTPEGEPPEEIEPSTSQTVADEGQAADSLWKKGKLSPKLRVHTVRLAKG